MGKQLKKYVFNPQKKFDPLAIILGVVGIIAVMLKARDKQSIQHFGMKEVSLW